ncbi:MAG: hypothetical protein ABSG73_14345 [Candidatus Aminicenantales bacterium]|jgi:hypothetical protein
MGSAPVEKNENMMKTMIITGIGLMAVGQAWGAQCEGRLKAYTPAGRSNMDKHRSLGEGDRVSGVQELRDLAGIK